MSALPLCVYVGDKGATARFHQQARHVGSAYFELVFSTILYTHCGLLILFCIAVYIYIYVCVCIHVYVYTYIVYIEKTKKERDDEGGAIWGGCDMCCWRVCVTVNTDESALNAPALTLSYRCTRQAHLFVTLFALMFPQEPT